MNLIYIYCFIVMGALLIDVGMNVAVSSSIQQKSFKPLGLIAIFFLCFSKGGFKHLDKQAALKRYILSFFTLLFLFGSILFLIDKAPLDQKTDLNIVMPMMPLLALPFFHLVHELLWPHPLSIDNHLFEFHVRGLASLSIGANVIFVLIQKDLPIPFLIAHAILAWIGLIALFYLSSIKKARTCPSSSVIKEGLVCFEAKFLYQLVFILELLYTCALVFQVFTYSLRQTQISPNLSFLFFFSGMAMLILLSLALVKIQFFFGSKLSLPLYQNGVLPVSFMLFGLAVVAEYYS